MDTGEYHFLVELCEVFKEDFNHHTTRISIMTNHHPNYLLKWAYDIINSDLWPSLTPEFLWRPSGHWRVPFLGWVVRGCRRGLSADVGSPGTWFHLRPGRQSCKFRRSGIFQQGWATAAVRWLSGFHSTNQSAEKQTCTVVTMTMMINNASMAQDIWWPIQRPAYQGVMLYTRSVE